MGGESSRTEQNVPSFSYCSADQSMPVLFELARPLDDLKKKLLLREFAGRTLTMKEIFDQHQVGRPYRSLFLLHCKTQVLTLKTPPTSPSGGRLMRCCGRLCAWCRTAARGIDHPASIEHMSAAFPNHASCCFVLSSRASFFQQARRTRRANCG
jgi:hypothetical protein